MSCKVCSALYQATIKLMVISLIASTLAGLIPPPLLQATVGSKGWLDSFTKNSS